MDHEVKDCLEEKALKRAEALEQQRQQARQEERKTREIDTWIDDTPQRNKPFQFKANREEEVNPGRTFRSSSLNYRSDGHRRDEAHQNEPATDRQTTESNWRKIL